MTDADSQHAARIYCARFFAQGVSVSRAGVRIIDVVSLSLAPGEAAILRGPNGAGKTTLLRAFAGLLRRDKGVVGVDENGAPHEEPTRAIIYCGPLSGAKAAMTVDENLDFWRALYGASSDMVETARAAFRLDRYGDRMAGALSTGLFRRLGLSRLILADKPVWLVDEPTASLDAASADIFAQHVERHRARGGVAIIATHDPLSLAGARNIELATEAKS